MPISPVRTVRTDSVVEQQPALLGGPPAIAAGSVPDDLFTWPIVTEEDEQAVLAVLHSGRMSGFDVTRRFEAEFAAWQGAAYALAHNTGTGAIQAALYALGVRAGDEVVCQSTTYWRPRRRRCRSAPRSALRTSKRTRSASTPPTWSGA